MMGNGHISVHDLKKRMDNGEDWQVFDVRSIYEYANGHIDGSVNLTVNSLVSRVDAISKNRPVALICASGGRSSIGCRLLMSSGFDNVYNVRGGMSAWVLSGYPTA